MIAAGVEDWQDVRVDQLPGDADLREESIGGDGLTQVLIEDLDRDGPRVPTVASEPDGRHAAAADLALNLVSVRERCGDSIDGFSHGRTEGMGLFYRCGGSL